MTGAMSSSTPVTNGSLLRASAHPHCVACSPGHPFGLKLDFHEVGGGGVRASFGCSAAFEGYPGNIHGGIISTLLDEAMAICLVFQNLTGVTAELVVKFKAPVLVNREASVEAKVIRDLFPLFLMEASLTQDGVVKATASAKFIASQGV